MLLLGTGIVWWWVETELSAAHRWQSRHTGEATRRIETLQEKASALRTELARLESQAKHLLVGRRWVPKTQIIDTLVRTRPKQIAWDEVVIRDDEAHQSSKLPGKRVKRALRPSGKTAGSFGTSGHGRQKSPALQERTYCQPDRSRHQVSNCFIEYLQSLGAIPFIRNVELVQSIIETGAWRRTSVRNPTRSACTEDISASERFLWEFDGGKPPEVGAGSITRHRLTVP